MKLALIILIAFACVAVACSAVEERQFAQEYPAMAPVAQGAERVQRVIDPVAQKSQQVLSDVRTLATDGATLGVPGAGIVALIATGLGSLLGVYNERRKGTLPLKSALHQVVQSVETAFPSKTEQQKLALASVQDHATASLVHSIKRRGVPTGREVRIVV